MKIMINLAFKTTYMGMGEGNNILHQAEDEQMLESMQLEWPQEERESLLSAIENHTGV